jgi:hypothetical protein
LKPDIRIDRTGTKPSSDKADVRPRAGTAAAEARKSSGGDFYRTQGVRLGKRFARALVISTLEGETQYGDAFRLLGFSKLATLRELGHRLGVV